MTKNQSLKPGSSEDDTAFADSMAEEIENALKMEWFAIKKQPLPNDGKADRRLLFAAIAQGVLSYLRNNNQFLISMPPLIPINIISPHIGLQPSEGNVNSTTISGSHFPANANVTITWDDPATNRSIAADANGHFSLNFQIPPGAKMGRHILETRDKTGNVALAVFDKS